MDLEHKVAVVQLEGGVEGLDSQGCRKAGSGRRSGRCAMDDNCVAGIGV
jgi:hypothetical protein